MIQECGDKLTIENAIENYKNHGHVLYGQALREALHEFARVQSNDPLDNDSYADALFLTDIMFSKTNRYMDILTGGGADTFLSVLRNPFTEALKRIKKVGGTLRVILVDCDTVPEILQELQPEYPIEWVQAKAVENAKIRHLIVCDDKMLRDEVPHGALKPQTPADTINAKVFLNSPVHVEIKKNYFDTVWGKLQG